MGKNGRKRNPSIPQIFSEYLLWGPGSVPGFGNTDANLGGCVIIAAGRGRLTLLKDTFPQTHRTPSHSQSHFTCNTSPAHSAQAIASESYGLRIPDSTTLNSSISFQSVCFPLASFIAFMPICSYFMCSSVYLFMFMACFPRKTTDIP